MSQELTNITTSPYLRNEAIAFIDHIADHFFGLRVSDLDGYHIKRSTPISGVDAVFVYYGLAEASPNLSIELTVYASELINDGHACGFAAKVFDGDKPMEEYQGYYSLCVFEDAMALCEWIKHSAMLYPQKIIH